MKRYMILFHKSIILWKGLKGIILRYMSIICLSYGVHMVVIT